MDFASTIAAEINDNVPESCLEIDFVSSNESNNRSNKPLGVASRAEKKINNVLRKMGYENPSKICDTLQGSIWRASETNTHKSVCVKVTNQKLYKESKAFIDGRSFSIKEDVLMEKDILKYLTQQAKCPNSIVKYVNFFKVCVYVRVFVSRTSAPYVAACTTSIESQFSVFPDGRWRHFFV